MADEVAIMPIYPAREKPMEGVSSEMIARKMQVPVSLLKENNLLKFIEESHPSLLVTAGAGDIDQSIASIKKLLLHQ
jgi:UDP-N-acetylmuramate--alanine ligase